MKKETIERIRKFSEDRDWDQFHSPANLAKSISIEASDRNNLLVDVMAVFNNAKVGVNNLHARSNTQNLSATISATIMVSDAKRLHDICVLLKGITGVYRVVRVIH